MPRHIPGTEYSKPIDPQKLAVGQRIAQKRNELGLSQAALGALIRTPHKPDGLTAGAIGLYERGMSFPEMEHFDQLPSILGCTREWLLTGSEKRSERARALDAQEFALLEAFRRQKPDTKVAVVQMLQGGRGGIVYIQAGSAAANPRPSSNATLEGRSQKKRKKG